MSLKPKVALSQEFVLQLARLPVSAHSKVMRWAVQFQANPMSPGINYENIVGARDPNLKSVRLDRDWRGIVFKPSSGDVYVLLHVDHHDDAYRWARNRKLAINPVTGALQLLIIDTVNGEDGPTERERLAPSDASGRLSESQDQTAAKAAIARNVQTANRGEAPPETQTNAVAGTTEPLGEPLFAALDDRELMGLGVPEEMISEVRAITNESQLDALQARLPVEGYEGLFLIAAGDTVNQILTDRESSLVRVIDQGDFATALGTPESRARFIVVDDDEAMLAIMNAPLAQWRVFLHPTQAKLASGKRTGPVRVLGGAGTGKTVLAMHRAKWLAEHFTAPGQKVLFTTFTKNLAADIESNLKTLCSQTTLSKIEVRNLDAWVHGFMRSRKLEHRIVYNRSEDGAQQAWQAAMAVRDTSLELPDDFYAKELDQVVLAQGITTRDQYRVARRTGRESLLSRAKRDAIWPVFEEYRGQLSSRRLKEVDDAYREVAELLAAETERYEQADDGDESKHGPNALPPYSAIVIDETQDFGPQALRLLRAMIPRDDNDLFFVGDGHQRIYSRNRAAMSKCGIDIRGRSKKLYLNYRTTDEIRRQAVALLEGCEIDDLDDGHDETRRYKSLSHGPAPEIQKVSSLEAARREVLAMVREFRTHHGVDQDTMASVCVIAPNEKMREAMAGSLSEAGLPCVTITAQANHSDRRDAVHFATMHRAKGLEFDAVVVVAPSSYLGAANETAAQRRLLYVALTRAKRAAGMVVVG